MGFIDINVFICKNNMFYGVVDNENWYGLSLCRYCVYDCNNGFVFIFEFKDGYLIMEKNSMKKLKCLFCGKATSLHTIKAKKKINDKLVTITNAPIYYCQECRETFLSKETQDVISYIRDNHLERRAIIFDFPQLHRELCKK